MKVVQMESPLTDMPSDPRRSVRERLPPSSVATLSAASRRLRGLNPDTECRPSTRVFRVRKQPGTAKCPSGLTQGESNQPGGTSDCCHIRTDAPPAAAAAAIASITDAMLRSGRPKPLLKHECDLLQWLLHRHVTDGHSRTFQPQHMRVLRAHALKLHDPEVLRLLIKYGVLAAREVDRISLDTSDGAVFSRPLHVAAARGSLAVVQVLVNAKADLEVTDAEDRTPLHNAAAGGHRDVGALLLRAGANPEAVDQFGDTPMDISRDAV
jgi:hypothetical protein